MPKPRDYEAMTNPELLKYVKAKRISLPPYLNNELAVSRGVTHDLRAEAAHDKVVSLLRSREDRNISKRAYKVSVASIAIAVFSLLVAIFKSV